METAPTEQPGQAPHRTDRLAVSSLVLAALAIFFIFIWFALGVGLSLHSTRNILPARNIAEFTIDLMTSLLLVTMTPGWVPLFLAFPTNLASLVTGIFALVQMRPKGGGRKGRWMAITGILLALAGLAGEALLVFMVGAEFFKMLGRD